MTTSGTPFADPGLQRWWLRAVICEIGDCQVLGAEHLVLLQPEPPRSGRAYWAVHVTEGAYGAVLLDGLCAVMALEAPQAPIVGRWSLSIYLDKRSNLLQREALESVLDGGVGSGFDRLGALVGPRLGTQVVPMDWVDAGRRVSLSSPRLLELVAEIPDRERPAAGTPAPKEQRGTVWPGRGCARFCGSGPHRGIETGAARLGRVFWHGVAAPRTPSPPARAPFDAPSAPLPTAGPDAAPGRSGREGLDP